MAELASSVDWVRVDANPKLGLMPISWQAQQQNPRRPGLLAGWRTVLESWATEEGDRYHQDSGRAEDKALRGDICGPELSRYCSCSTLVQVDRHMYGSASI